MTQCKFCPVEKKEPYVCPRCNANYCSIKCYRSQAHATCSEQFYKDCVKEQLQGKQHEGPSSETFEEHMKKYLNGELDEMPGPSGGKNDDEGEPLDSDDEDEMTAEQEEHNQYLQKVLKGTIDEYTLEDDELDRRLLAMGLGSDVEQMMNALSPEERAAFAQLAEQVHQNESGLGTSCFSNSS